MHDARPVSSIEQRRKLLKGALAASGVVTMGYSGAALASFECVAQVRTSGAATLPTTQFTMTEPTTANGGSWAWVKVSVYQYKTGTAGVGGVCTSATGPKFDAFKLNETDSVVYKTSEPAIPVSGACKASTQQPGYPKDGWVLAYFDDGGSPAGPTLTSSTYPTYTTADIGHTPAAQSCLASVNPGLNLSDFTFGG